MLNSSQVLSQPGGESKQAGALPALKSTATEPGQAPNPLGRPSSPAPTAPPCDPFVYISSALRRLFLQARITSSRNPVASIEGEPGAGKHLFAQNLHQQSTLAGLPFRRCDARQWLASECDASSLTGTLYLDRVDLLAPAGQALLLAFVKMLQDKHPADFQIYASTQTSLRQLAGLGIFQPDLAFRLASVSFSLPPLRDHREDIAPITQALLERICRRYQQPSAILASGSLPRLLQHPWTGNVRELYFVLESSILTSTTGVLRPSDLPLDIPRLASPAIPSRSCSPQPLSAPLSSAPDADLTLDTAIQAHIRSVLERNRGNKLRAARQLGISRSTLYRLIAGEINPLP